MSLEQRLKQALRRTEPDEDFAARVLARLDAAPAVEARRSSSTRHWALAACLVVAVGAGLFVQQERARERTETASRQLAYALELTSRELEHVHKHLERKTEEKGS
jgi:hypothetical protein